MTLKLSSLTAHLEHPKLQVVEHWTVQVDVLHFYLILINWRFVRCTHVLLQILLIFVGCRCYAAWYSLEVLLNVLLLFDNDKKNNDKKEVSIHSRTDVDIVIDLIPDSSTSLNFMQPKDFFKALWKSWYLKR